MKMEFFLRSHFCSIVHVAALVVCFLRNVPGEIAQGCVGSQLSLRCQETKVIKITTVVLGDSNCIGASCCIKDNDCTHAANANHRDDVHRGCDDKQSCIVNVVKEKIPCGWYNNDFERITYNCTNKGRNVGSNSADVQPTVDSLDHLVVTCTTPATGAIATICVVCLAVIIAIVAIVSVVTIRRKKRRLVNSPHAIKTIGRRTHKNEAIVMNKDQGTSLKENAASTFPINSNDSSKDIEKSLNSCSKSLESPTNDYCEIKGLATEKVQNDGEYEQLDHRRNCEPLIVYQELQLV